MGSHDKRAADAAARVAKRLAADEPKDRQLRLGCFELPEAPAKKAKPEKPKGPTLPSPKPTNAPDALASSATRGSGGESRATAGTPAGAIPEEKPAVERESSEERREQRREREYFKAYFGELCGPNDRILLEGELGRGSFSSVFRCKDTKDGKEYAVKFIRANKALKKVMEREIQLMRRLRSEASEKDSEGASCILSLAGPETFVHQGHLALVFHLQKCDMRTALYEERSQPCGPGFSLPEIQGYARNIFLALRVLRQIRIIHDDLKPDNLLLSLDRKSVKLSDFGSAIDLNAQERRSFRPTYTSHYRAPEVLLGHSYSTRADIWSAGATLFELAASRPLLLSRNNNGKLHELMRLCGSFPAHLVKEGKGATRHFTPEGDFRFRKQEAAAAERKKKGAASQKPVEEEVIPLNRFPKPVQAVRTLLEGCVQELPSFVAASHQSLCDKLADLVERCVRLDPAKRPGPEDVLNNAFLTAK